MGAGKPFAAIGLLLSLSSLGCDQLVGAEDVSTDGAGTVANAAPAQGTPAPGGLLDCLYQPKSAEVGVTSGKSLPAGFSWKGFVGAAQDPSTVNATDFYDCNGSKGVHATVYELAKFG